MKTTAFLPRTPSTPAAAMIVELPDGGEIFNKDTIGGIVSEWERIAQVSSDKTAFGLLFSNVSTFDADVAPIIRKFIRRFQVKHLGIASSSPDAARRILSAVCPYMNLEAFTLTGTTPSEVEISLPLALRRTTTSVTALHFKSVAVAFSTLEEWASMMGTSVNPPVKWLSIRDLTLQDGGRVDNKTMHRMLARIVGRMSSLTSFEFEPSTNSNDPAANGFEYFSKALSSLPSIKVLTFSGLDCGNKRYLEMLFGSRSKLRKSLEELSLLSCEVDRAVVDKLISPRPYVRLREINVSGNPSLERSDLAALKKMYLKVIGDNFESSEDDDDGSSEASSTESYDDYAWYNSQLP